MNSQEAFSPSLVEQLELARRAEAHRHHPSEGRR